MLAGHGWFLSAKSIAPTPSSMTEADGLGAAGETSCREQAADGNVVAMRVACVAALLLPLLVSACGDPSRPPEVGFGVSADAGLNRGDGATAQVFGPQVAPTDDPSTCAEAAAWQSYVGCDYWPTVVANDVWSVFDFA